ncbi:HAD family hydrolase [Ferrimonas sp. SCSIO 43195]|uniref:HAD family hydrolase n=2 Tax=Ferrimonas TaxID=44011 RepID=UPI002076439E|nr:HAD family hydrolase [Ferrimonas sp. SCSIO 43195]USD38545.1 HAD family hydrolase [Ferrimonas sp. SCSIO 43195]
MPLDAILWDYDGTLVNSVPKNINITQSILADIAPHLTGANLPHWLQSESAYHHANHAARNWQDLYQNYYGLSAQETTEAGALWAKYQRSNTTEVRLFEGIASLLHSLTSLPHGVCSQNDASTIWALLKREGVDTPFHSIMGYNDVEGGQQKPHPAGGLQCVEAIFGAKRPRQLMYIGDHQGDVEFARNLNQALGSDCNVIAVTAAYSGATPQRWQQQPDHVADTPQSLLSICQSYL